MGDDQYTHCQCFLFILNDPILKNAKQLRSSAKTRTQKTTAPRTRKVLALLPYAYAAKNAEMLNVFKKNNIDIINRKNESCLFNKSSSPLKMVEIQLDDDCKTSIDPLYVVTDIHDKYIRQLFPKTTIVQEMHYAPNIRPALDDLNFKLVERLLMKKVGIRYMYGGGSETSLLHLAAKRGQEPFVQLLLDHNADVNERDVDECTPLHGAVSGGHPAVVRLLIKHGAVVDARNKYGSTPLFKTSPEFLCARQDLFPEAESLRKVYAAIGKILLESGANVNARCNRKRTPLMNAARVGLWHLAHTLVHNGAQVDILDEDDKSVINHVSDRKHFSLMQFFLECCFLDITSLNFNKMSNGICFLAEHIVKVLMLGLQPDLDFADILPRNLPLGFGRNRCNRDTYENECRDEIAKMESQIPVGSSVSLYDVLKKTESQVASLLKNEAYLNYTNDFTVLTEQYPIYGKILDHHLQTGLSRKYIIEDGIKIFSRLSPHFDGLPDEMKERIVVYLSNRDVLVLSGLEPITSPESLNVNPESDRAVKRGRARRIDSGRFVKRSCSTIKKKTKRT